MFAFAILFWIVSSPLPAQTSEARVSQSKVERGLTGLYRFEYAGKPLQAKSQRDTDAPLGMRLSSSPEDRKQYEAKYVGNREGSYDLRLLMEHVDGSEITDLGPMLVQIVSTLPKDLRSDLFETADFQPSLWGGYRMVLGAVALIWLSIPIGISIRRSMRSKPQEDPQVVEPSPTFADQIKPLIEAAVSQTLTVREKGRLELLLVHYWRERVSLQSLDMASTIQQLRSHPEAGPLVTSLERWLHQSEMEADASRPSPDTIVDLLKPYRGSAPIVEAEARSVSP